MLGIIVLIVFGLIMIYSSSSYTAQITYNDAAYFVKNQAKYAAVGAVLLFICARFINYKWLCDLSEWGYAFALILAILTLVVGREINGTKRWLGIGGFSFQPAEIIKIILIVFLAQMIVHSKKRMDTTIGLLFVWALALIPAGLVGYNSLTSGIVLILITAAMTYVATDVKWIYLIILVCGILLIVFRKPVTLFVTSLGIFKPYQMNRFLVWVEPEAHPLDGGYQVLQGLYAIGSGGVFGKGLGQSIQKLGFIPEAQNDMIFTIICEELGFIGALFVIVLYIFVILKIKAIAESVRSKRGKLICVGVASHIAIQAVLNIAVACNVIPNTGVTLPFISCGGTSLVCLMIEIGIVLNISRSTVYEVSREERS